MMYLETAIAMYQDQNINFTFYWPDKVNITLENGGVQEVNMELFLKVNEVLEQFKEYVLAERAKVIEKMKQKTIEVLGVEFLVIFDVIQIPYQNPIVYEVNDIWINGTITNPILKSQVDALLGK